MIKLYEFLTKLGKTGVRVAKVEHDEKTGMVLIFFELIDCNIMIRMGECIKSFFGEEGKNYHLLPTLVAKKGWVCLSFHKSLVE